jgi:hypothetical protein
MVHRLLPLLTLLTACDGPTNHPLPDPVQATTDTDPAPVACTDDRFERDDHFRTSTRVLPTDRWTATSCGDDHDWYVFEVEAGARGLFTLTHPLGAEALVGVLYDGEIEPVAADHSYLDGQLLLEATPEERTLYYVDVRPDPDDRSDGSLPYAGRFDQDLPAVCPPDPLEPDQAPASATPLHMGETTGLTACLSDRADWFSVELHAGESLTVTTRHAVEEGELHLFLLDLPTGSTYPALKAAALAHASGAGDDGKLQLTAPLSGTFHLVVFLREATGAGWTDGLDYALDVSIGGG